MAMRYAFDDFEVDTARYELRRAGLLQPLEPQGFNVLVYLLAHRERVVPKQELLAHLWPDQQVTEATLTQRLLAIRRALGDTGRAQRYIRTVQRRGYRFVASVVVAPEAPVAASATVPPLAPPRVVGPRQTLFVGREEELARLQACLARALRGERQVVLVSGEAGIGKTALVDAFVAQVQATTPVWVGRGQCIEHYGAGEAYLPVLEALSRLGREAPGPALVTALRQQAPSWLPHLPALRPADGTTRLPQSATLTPERMLRELSNALEQVTATQPLLLILEDLHWSDVSTVDWLSYMARRRDPAQLCIVGTYRPGDALAQGHPLPVAVREFARQQQAHELPLPYWTVAELTAYLVQRFGTLPFAGTLIQLLHQRTNGNPFFLVALVDTMATPEHLEALTTTGSTLPAALPASIRHLITYQLEALTADEQGLLEAASVVGDAFATAAVAAAHGATIDVVEQHCDTLARKGQFVYPLGIESWPDGTVSTRYGFRHALYHDVLYERLALGRRVRLHQQIAQSKERAYGAQAATIAAELAMHFVRGQVPHSAVHYLQCAGEQAVQRSAYQEALQHLSQGLTLLTTLPETAARDRQELDVQLALGTVLMASTGVGSPAVERTYRRARVLSHQIGTPAQRFPVLWGLWRLYQGRAQHQDARQVGEDLLTLAHSLHDPALLLAAYQALGSTCYFTGDFALARTYLEQGLACYQAQPQAAEVFHVSIAPAVYCLALASQTLWTLGYPEQALRQSQEATALAQTLAHAQSLVFAQYYAARLHSLRREFALAARFAEATLTLATTQGFPYYHGLAMFLRGWVTAMEGQGEAGVAQMYQGVQEVQRTETALAQPFFLTFLAEIHDHLGQTDTARHLLADADSLVAANGQRGWAAETARLQGLLWLHQAEPDVRQAEACFHQALTIARHQQAKALELRAALSLGRLWQRQGKGEAARHLVRAIYAWFTEGMETSDLQQARAFLQGAADA